MNRTAITVIMNTKHLLAILLSSLAITGFLIYSLQATDPPKDTIGLFVGVDVAYDDLNATKQLIDEVSAYTNLFVVGCTGITDNTTKLNDLCQYIYEKNLSFIVYREITPRTEWLEEAKTRWGNQFLGFYAFDEVGGWQLDLQDYRPVVEAENVTDAATQFNDTLGRTLTRFTRFYSNSTDIPLFTSDYALYWFDYKAGYDTVTAQFGWNYSRQLNVALCRGAANVQGKDWGAMITWTYTESPYIESGDKLYEDLILAYNNGAKYIMVFDSDENYTQGILQEEHLLALKNFWHYTQNNPRPKNLLDNRIAFVLPKDYAYGFRGPADKVWGLWEADAFSYELCTKLNTLIEKYNMKLDVIYEDGLEPDNSYGYSQFIFWNGTIMTP
jgi:hypothetical protein